MIIQMIMAYFKTFRKYKQAKINYAKNDISFFQYYNKITSNEK